MHKKTEKSLPSKNPFVEYMISKTTLNLLKTKEKKFGSIRMVNLRDRKRKKHESV